MLDAKDLRHEPADLGWRIELDFAVATLGGEMAHQVFIGVAKNIIAIRPVLRDP